jgi:uncharacterized protein YbbC (DUF1343 family)
MHYKGELCEGVRIIITDEQTLQPVEVGYHITETLCYMYPEHFNFKLDKTKHRLRMVDLANGTDKIRLMFENKVPVENIINSYQADLDKFIKVREKYLIYK